MAEEENLSLEEGGSERGNRRARKEEPKLSDVRVATGGKSEVLQLKQPTLFIFSLTDGESYQRQHSRT